MTIRHRQFNPKWTSEFAFILPLHTNAKPLCLICQCTVAVCKVENVRRHFTAKLANFNYEVPPGSTARKGQIESRKSSYAAATTILKTAATSQEKATAASLRVMFLLAKKRKPCTDCEVVEECTLELVEERFAGDTNKEEIVNRVKQVPLSDTSAMRRLEVLFEDCFAALLSDLKSTEYMSLAVDESTDVTDMSQLSMFVRYFDGDIFKEELLSMLPLTTHTTGEAIFSAVKTFFEEKGLDLGKINLLVTDGCPSMIGKERGIVSRIVNEYPTVNSLHCIIHQTVLCAKLSGKLKEAMDTVISIVNHIRSTLSLQHRLFKMLLQEQEAEFTDLLQHNGVRWLSRGRVLEQFYALRNEVSEFLSSQKSNKDFMVHIGFFATFLAT